MAAAAAISEKPLAVQIVYTRTLRRKLISEIQKFKLILAGGTDPQASPLQRYSNVTAITEAFWAVN